MKALKDDNQYGAFFETLQKLPGGDALLHALEDPPASPRGDGDGPNAAKG